MKLSGNFVVFYGPTMTTWSLFSYKMMEILFNPTGKPRGRDFISSNN